MDEKQKTEKVKRTQKDYTLAFKLMVVDEVEKGFLSYRQAQVKYGIQGNASVLRWLRKFGKLKWNEANHMRYTDTPSKKIKDLEKRVKELELEKEVLNKAIDIADEQFDTNIRKKYYALSLKLTKRQSEK
jgi:transposase-like protein